MRPGVQVAVADHSCPLPEVGRLILQHPRHDILVAAGERPIGCRIPALLHRRDLDLTHQRKEAFGRRTASKGENACVDGGPEAVGLLGPLSDHQEVPLLFCSKNELAESI